MTNFMINLDFVYLPDLRDNSVYPAPPSRYTLDGLEAYPVVEENSEFQIFQTGADSLFWVLRCLDTLRGGTGDSVFS